jgi:hypothetical protein
MEVNTREMMEELVAEIVASVFTKTSMQTTGDAMLPRAEEDDFTTREWGRWTRHQRGDRRQKERGTEE